MVSRWEGLPHASRPHLVLAQQTSVAAVRTKVISSRDVCGVEVRDRGREGGREGEGGRAWREGEEGRREGGREGGSE